MEALKFIPTLHADAVKPKCVLIKTNYRLKKIHEALTCFDDAMYILEFHLGNFHPVLFLNFNSPYNFFLRYK